MKFPFFASFLVLILVITHAIHRTTKLDKQNMNSFWEREANANQTRRKPLEGLSYIQIPLERLTKDLSAEDTEIAPYIERLESLSREKIFNLNGMTNTELKLTYGVANFGKLSQYDQNYIELITLLQELASLLFQREAFLESLKLAEYAISIGSDIRGTYELAVSLYERLGTPRKIAGLLPMAEKLTSPNKALIVRRLHESDPDNG